MLFAKNQSKAIKPNQKGDKDIQAAIKETSKYSVKSSDFLTDDDEKNQEIVNDLEKGLYRKRMLSYGGLLKQKHKIFLPKINPIILRNIIFRTSKILTFNT